MPLGGPHAARERSTPAMPLVSDISRMWSAGAVLLSILPKALAWDGESLREGGVDVEAELRRKNVEAADAANVRAAHVRAAPSWEVEFGSCTFSGPEGGGALVRSGSCPEESGTLDLRDKGITSVPADAFADMGSLG